MTNQTIYIIDDEQQAVDLLAEYAQLLGYQACTYNNATQYFEEIESHTDGSLMILDINMPKMDGIEVMRRMVKTNNILPLILVSGYDSGVLHSAEQLARAHSLDIIATITKPFQLKDLQNIIQKYRKLERRHTSRLELPITVNEFEKAIFQNQLVLHYQPQIDIESSALTGVEALVR